MAVKPSSKPAWTQSNPAVRTEPTGSKKNAGWGIGERPAREYENWLNFIMSEWIDYFEEVTDQFGSLYQAIVGTGFYADINAAITAVAAGSRILVLDSATINTTQSISKNRIQIDFQPGVIYTKGTAAPALQVQADYCKINGGEFFNFSGGGDSAIIVDAGSDYTKIRDSHFRTCTTDVTDNAATTSIQGTTTEV